MKIAAISDVHGKWNKLEVPSCDLLISCGDYSFKGESHMVRDFHKWLNKQDATHIISVQGNHELWVENNFEEAKKIAKQECPRVHFAQHELIEIEGIKIFASAWTPEFFNWAWNAKRGPEIAKLWSEIPLDTDILVTHGPPKNILDAVYYFDKVTVKDRVGCEDLANRIMQLDRLQHHFFGHIHGSYGHKNILGKKFWNVSNCDESYSPSNPVVVVDF